MVILKDVSNTDSHPPGLVSNKVYSLIIQLVFMVIKMKKRKVSSFRKSN